MNLTLPLLAAAAASTIPATPHPSPETRAACRSAIHEVREAAGLPGLDRGVAREDEALLIAAVDKRIDDCRVLVMAGNPSDIRPEPEITNRRAQLRPARRSR